MKKSARELRSIKRNRVRTRSWSKKGLRSKRRLKAKSDRFSTSKKVTVDELPMSYTHIDCNEFVHRRHKELLEDDIPVCSCTAVKDNPESACGYRCLNFLTSNECTSGFCPCGDLCKNQRFQRRNYIRTRLEKTDERGWGLIADQDAKAGEFIIEYCGEVISCEEARKRSQAYEAEGLQDAYIISLDGSESIDATRKGSLARFINHSCDPNCETRKWTVLGEVRVGIFAKLDIKGGTELTYNYNFEWYGGAKVRCRCGALSCVGFLGAKSRGFQKDSYVWEDNDDRYSVENVPLYDSEDDEPLSSFFRRAQVTVKLKKTGPKGTGTSTSAGTPPLEKGPECSSKDTGVVNTVIKSEGNMEMNVSESGLQHEVNENKTPIVSDEELLPVDSAKCGLSSVVVVVEKENPTNSPRVDATIQETIDPAEVQGEFQKRAKLTLHPGSSNIRKNLRAHNICQFLSSEMICQELYTIEEAEAAASYELDKLQSELRPHLAKDVPDNLPTSSAEEWIALTCKHLQSVFDFNYSVLKNVSHVFPKLTPK